MLTVTTALEYGIGLLAVAGAGYFLVVMWRRRAEPAARQLLVVAALLFAGALVHLAVFRPTPVEEALAARVWVDATVPLWMGVISVVVILVSGVWFLFTIQYTGRGGRLFPIAAAMVVLLWLFVFGMALFGDLSLPPEFEAEGVTATTAEIALGVGGFFAIILLSIGVILVLTTSLERNALPFGEALSLSGGASAIAFGFTGFNATGYSGSVPLSMALASGLFVFAVRRYPTFEAPPVVRIAGRDRLIEELDDAVVVVDPEGRIRDLNPAAEGCFEIDRETILGEPVSALFSASVDLDAMEDAAEPVSLRTETGTAIEVGASRIRDARDRSFGHLLVCRDVTERERRERRLGVLNRTLTGQISDRMAAVADEAAALAAPERAADTGPGPAAVGTEIRTETTELVELVARTREIERALARAGDDRTDVVGVLREAVEGAPADGALELDIGEEPLPAATGAAVLEVILETVIDDAIERGREPVELRALDTDEGPEVHVLDGRVPPETTGCEADNTDPGPGGTDFGAGETDAEAGGSPAVARTGSTRREPAPPDELSVEMARLAANQVGGDVSVSASETGRRRTVIELPGVDRSAAEPTAPDDVRDSDERRTADERPALSDGRRRNDRTGGGRR